MRWCGTLSSVLAAVVLFGLPGVTRAQVVSEPVIEATAPARFQAGDTVRVSFRYQVPDSVGRARVLVLLLSGDEVVGALRRVRPSVVQGTGVAEALEVFADPVVTDAIRVVLSGSGGFLEASELPLGVVAGSRSGGFLRPGWIDPGGLGGADDAGPTRGEDSIPEARVVALAVDPRLPLASLPDSPRDTLTLDEASRFSPAALRRLAVQLDRPRVVLPSGAELLRRREDPALAEVLRSPAVVGELDRPLAPPDGEVSATPDTLGVPGPWTIEADGSMRRTWPDGTEEVIDAAGNRLTCAPDPESEEMLCMMPFFSQIPRVIPSSELATVDAAWLESMDAWLEQLAADALSEMRALVADDASIEAYLGLEEGQNLYQRLDQRLEFLNRLIN